MASFLVLFLLAVSEGRRYGWGAPMIMTLFVLAGSALLIFLVTELTIEVPFVDLGFGRDTCNFRSQRRSSENLIDKLLPAHR
jgi:hypothetical protein